MAVEKLEKLADGEAEVRLVTLVELHTPLVVWAVDRGPLEVRAPGRELEERVKLGLEDWRPGEID